MIHEQDTPIPLLEFLNLKQSIAELSEPKSTLSIEMEQTRSSKLVTQIMIIATVARRNALFTIIHANYKGVSNSSEVVSPNLGELEHNHSAVKRKPI